MDTRTRYLGNEAGAMEEAIRTIVESEVAGLYTHVPFKVVSVDFSKKPPTLVAQPTIKARIRQPDGTQAWVALPQVPDVPIHFQGGGGVSVTFPVKAGDEGLLMISNRSIDAFHQSGGEQQQMELRPHDLSNAYALVGTRTQATALDSVSDQSTQIRTDDGNHVVDLHPSNGLSLSSSQGINLTVGGVSLALTSGGLAVTGGTITHDGHNIGGSHVHGGVTPGGGDTSSPH